MPPYRSSRNLVPSFQLLLYFSKPVAMLLKKTCCNIFCTVAIYVATFQHDTNPFSTDYVTIYVKKNYNKTCLQSELPQVNLRTMCH
jgi:hypothetical protein